MHTTTAPAVHDHLPTQRAGSTSDASVDAPPVTLVTLGELVGELCERLAAFGDDGPQDLALFEAFEALALRCWMPANRALGTPEWRGLIPAVDRRVVLARSLARLHELLLSTGLEHLLADAAVLDDLHRLRRRMGATA